MCGTKGSALTIGALFALPSELDVRRLGCCNLGVNFYLQMSRQMLS